MRRVSAPRARLPAVLADRLDARGQALLALGSLLEDEHVARPGERKALRELTERLRNTYPYPDPRYAGQMLKPPAAIAWAAYATTMLLNPNNHALDGGPATAAMEKEAVEQLATMFGLPRHLGHLTSSGTIANLEALWVARALHPDAAIVSAANAHYTHARVCAVLGARHETIPENACGRLDVDALEQRVRRGGVGTVVVTPGTTALGALDDVGAVADLCQRHGARLHVDAAYGGFFALLADGAGPGVACAPFAAIARADSIVVDPHKHGLQPYGCGCVLFADPAVGSSTRTTRPTRTSHPTSCTSARSAWSARAPAPPPRRCGRRCVRSRSRAPGSGSTSHAREPQRWTLPRRCGPTGARRSSSSPSSTSSASCRRAPPPARPAARQRVPSTRSPTAAGTSPSSVSARTGCAAAIPRSSPMPRRRPCCAAACSSTSTPTSRRSSRPPWPTIWRTRSPDRPARSARAAPRAELSDAGGSR